MLTTGKWESLSPKTRLRKLALLLQKWEGETSRGVSPEFDSVRSLLRSEAFREQLPVSLLKLLEDLLKFEGDPPRLIRCLNNVRHGIQRILGSEPAEWDLLEHGGEGLAGSRRVLPIEVYLEDIRSPFNVGSIFRTSEAFGVERIIISPDTPLPTHTRAARTSRGCEEVIPWEVMDLSILESMQGVFALETGGTPIDRFRFPLGRGVVLVGSEELGLSPEALRLADASAGRVSIPLMGAKRSLNVSVAFGILIWFWSSTLM
jgi:TrmH family RNA methyltransferase